MARKSVSKKSTPLKNKKRSRKKITLKIQLAKAFAGLFVLLVLVIISGLGVHYLLLKKPTPTPLALTEKTIPPQPPAPQVKIPVDQVEKVPPEKLPSHENNTITAKIPKVKKPVYYEIFPDKDLFPPKTVPKRPPTVPSKERPKIAIIIDDLGYDPVIAGKFVELEPNLTFAVIPHTPFQRKVAETVRKKGGELMLHIPMEPNEYPEIDPGPGALLTSMEPDQLIAQLKVNLDTLSDAKGINGHMGSKLTANSEKMNQIFTILKQRHLYFVDSLTTPDSVCKPSAKMLRVPFAQRDVFIDHFLEPEFMRKQVHRLIKNAVKNGEAIGIAHPHKETFQVLQELMPEIKKQADLVPASILVR